MKYWQETLKILNNASPSKKPLRLNFTDTDKLKKHVIIQEAIEQIIDEKKHIIMKFSIKFNDEIKIFEDFPTMIEYLKDSRFITNDYDYNKKVNIILGENEIPFLDYLGKIHKEINAISTTNGNAAKKFEEKKIEMSSEESNDDNENSQTGIVMDDMENTPKPKNSKKKEKRKKDGDDKDSKKSKKKSKKRSLESDESPTTNKKKN